MTMNRLIPQRRLFQLGIPGLAAAGTLGALGLARARFQNSRLFAQERLADGPRKLPFQDAEGQGLEVQECWFESEDGVRLHGWWIPRPEAKTTVLYCHGNSGSLGLGFRVLRHIAPLNANLFVFDYRGYGRREGKPSELGLFKDARAAFQHLTDSIDQDPETIVLFGHSLGGAVAIDAALELPAAGLVVQASFTDVRGMARVLFPRLPMHWLARNQFRSIDKVPQISMPKLFIHGGRDDTIPFEMGRQLFDAAEEEKQFLGIERGGHNNLHLRGGEEYLDTLQRFLDRSTGG